MNTALPRARRFGIEIIGTEGLEGQASARYLFGDMNLPLRSQKQ